MQVHNTLPEFVKASHQVLNGVRNRARAAVQGSIGTINNTLIMGPIQITLSDCTAHLDSGGNDGGCNCLIELLLFLCVVLAGSQNLLLYRPFCRIQTSSLQWLRLTGALAVPGTPTF
jgi:hypothetical protein